MVVVVVEPDAVVHFQDRQGLPGRLGPVRLLRLLLLLASVGRGRLLVVVLVEVRQLPSGLPLVDFRCLCPL